MKCPERYFLWPPYYQRQSIVKMASRIKAFTIS